MKKIFTIATLCFLVFSGYSQQFNQVVFSGGSDLSCLTLLTDQRVLVRISSDGKIIEFGTEQQSLYNANYFAQKLQPYLGRIDYYPNESDSAFRGKVRSIGTCFFMYYPATDYPERAGKIKTAGNLMFDYYRKFDDVLMIGKIKNIGNTAIGYYASTDDEAFKGKLKMVGNTSIFYYSSYENAQTKGKLKTVGQYRYAWTYLDQTNLNRSSNMASQRQLVNGIFYILQ